MERDLKDKVKAWAEKIGNDAALIKLAKAGVSISLGQKILANGYESDLKKITCDAIKKAMAS